MSVRKLLSLSMFFRLHHILIALVANLVFSLVQLQWISIDNKNKTHKYDDVPTGNFQCHSNWLRLAFSQLILDNLKRIIEFENMIRLSLSRWVAFVNTFKSFFCVRRRCFFFVCHTNCVYISQHIWKEGTHKNTKRRRFANNRFFLAKWAIALNRLILQLLWLFVCIIIFWAQKVSMLF